MNIDTLKLAISVLNATLALDDLPLEIHGRIATVLMLLDHQEGEDYFAALEEAYKYLGEDDVTLNALEGLIDNFEDSLD